MWMILVGILAFFAFYLYDYLQIRFPQRNHFALFLGGILLLVLATGGLICRSIRQSNAFTGSMIVPILCGTLFLLLLIYTLFFAIPYEASYQDPLRKKVLVSSGVYSLCRHPGILWFSTLYFFLWLAFGGGLLFLSFLLFSFLNGLYAYLQDRWVFPKQFDGYDDYQKKTPFLIPTRESICACVETFRSRTP